MEEKKGNDQLDLNELTSQWSDPEKLWEEVQGNRQKNQSNPMISVVDPDNYVEPRTPTEKIVAQIWAEFLGVEPVGIYDGFTKLGGHSLMVMEILARVQELFQIQVPMATFFSDTDFTVAELAKIIDEFQINQANEAELNALQQQLDQLSDEEVRELLARETR